MIQTNTCSLPHLCIGLCLAISALFTSCSPSSKKAETAQTGLSDSIMVILRNIPDTRLNIRLGGRSYEVSPAVRASWVNDLGEVMSYPVLASKQDTLVIHTREEQKILAIPVWPSFSGHQYFPLKRGETYTFDFVGQLAHTKREGLAYLEKFYDTLYNQVLIDSVPATEWGNMPSFPILGDSLTIDDWIGRKYPDSYLAQMQRELDYMHSYIVGLEKQGLGEEGQFLKRYIYRYEQALQEHHPNLQFRYLTEGEQLPLYEQEECDEERQRLPANLFHIYDGVPRTMKQRDAELSQAEVSPALKRQVLSEYLGILAQEAPPSVYLSEAKTYQTIYPDTELLRHIARYYHIDTTVYSQEQVELVALDGKRTTLAEVLATCVGKPVVVDLWASWCHPCLEDIRSGKDKRRQEQKQGVRYIFLAWSDKLEDWRAQVTKLGLAEEPYCFFVLNSDSQWFTQHKVQSLPTKLYYDRLGKLVSSHIGR